MGETADENWHYWAQCEGKGLGRARRNWAFVGRYNPLIWCIDSFIKNSWDRIYRSQVINLADYLNRRSPFRSTVIPYPLNRLIPLPHLFIKGWTSPLSSLTCKIQIKCAHCRNNLSYYRILYLIWTSGIGLARILRCLIIEFLKMFNYPP